MLVKKYRLLGTVALEDLGNFEIPENPRNCLKAWIALKALHTVNAAEVLENHKNWDLSKSLKM